ncbi:hypothetical protein [Elizabethkingia meningoseptica]|uniref:hypothetical protein n=1 Tax=Elizabethkingia meningoseptica TaxID=238 RepID=UPI001624F640|nr:hypothetical protein [Elizabethkingia meningoseptica]HAY3553758.1 hypothetical protein [Elizabethkingia meningoseptica]
MIPRKKKICKSCETEKYLFGKGLCKPCYLRLNNKPINKISQKHKELLIEYTVIRKEFLESCNYTCQVKLNGCTTVATDIHHISGKHSKELYLNPKFFLSTCRSCHKYIEEHPVFAYENGFSVKRL